MHRQLGLFGGEEVLEYPDLHPVLGGREASGLLVEVAGQLGIGVLSHGAAPFVASNYFNILIFYTNEQNLVPVPGHEPAGC
jgi:hypothetical protein